MRTGSLYARESVNELYFCLQQLKNKITKIVLGFRLENNAVQGFSVYHGDLAGSA